MKFKGLLKVALLLVAVSALFVACDTLAGGRFPHVEKVYMKPGEDWASDKPVYAAWMWTDGKEGSWTELTKSTIEEDLWEVAVPNEIDNIIFVKMKDGTTKDKFSWDNKEEQTADLKVPYVFDNVQVYSIKAKEWIALGAEEKEPEKPVLEPVAISAAEFTSLKYAAQSNPTDIELEADKSFTFYASSKTYKFKYTDGTWAFTAITGEAIAELDKEYPIVKKGDTKLDNIELKNLQDGVEYKVSLTHKDGFAYVKVTKTGNAITTLPEVYSYTVKKANISDDWGGKPERAAFGVLLLTDTELAAAKTATNYDYLGNPATKLNDKNLLVYTHENGSFILKDEKGDTFDNVAAVVTDDSITVYVKVSGTLVEKGKKAYVVALDENDTPIIDNIWSTSLAAMNANATWPAGELKENKEPDNAPKGYYKLTRYVGSMTSWGEAGVALSEDNSFEYESNGTTRGLFRYTSGSWAYTIGGVKINAAGTFTLNSEVTDDDKNIWLDLPAGIYKIQLVVNAQDSANVVVTKIGEYVPPADCGIFYTPDEGYIYLLATTTGSFQDTNNWTSDNAWFTAWCWGSSSELDSFVPFEKVEGYDKLYRAKVNDYKQCKILRFGPDYSEPVWDKQWNTTGELTIPSKSDVCLVITQWDGQTSGWLPFATE